VFLIVFKTGHACPLVSTRFLCPPIRRRASGERPRDMLCRWPPTRHICGLEQALHMTSPHPLHVREQSVSANSPQTQPRQRTVRVCGQIEAATVREPTWYAVENGPKTGSRRRPSTFSVAPLAETGREPRSPSKYTLRRIAVFMFPPANFSIPIRKILRHVLI
jgi:hypothetical protein